MKNLSLLIGLLFVSFSAQAQNYKLGNVSAAELKEVSHKLEPDAPAAILYKKGTTSFDFDNQGHQIVVTEVEARIKIYTKEGYKYANITVPYYIGGKDGEEVSFEEVVTYNLVNGKIEKTKLTDESKFTEEVNNEWRIKKITLPNVKEGSVIEYHYIIKSPYIANLNSWYFQYDIPVNDIEYNAFIPAYYVYNRILSPYVPIKEKQDNEKVTRRYTNPNSKGGYGQATSLGQSETGQVSFYEVRRTYTAQNVPSLTDEGYVDNIENYRSFVKHELASSHMPGYPEKKYATDWNSITKSVYEDNNFGKQIAASSYFEQDLDQVLKGKMHSNEIIAAVFDFVKNRMAWDGTYGYVTNKGVKKAYTDKTGNIAEINLMLLSMLRYAGLNVNPVLLSTRDNGHVSFINRNEFNYVVVGVEQKDKIVYLDATSKNASPDILPIRDLNGTGRIMRQNFTSAEVDMMPKTNSKENVHVMAKIDADGSITGQAKTQLFDYNAYLFKEKNANLSNEAYVQKLEKKLNNAEISDSNIVNTDNYTLPVVENFSFKSTTLSDVIDDKIYISPMLFYTISQNPFKQENRVYPIDFVFPREDKFAITLTMPEGYIIESMPEPVSFSTRDNVASFKFNIAVNKSNQVQIIASSNINYANVSPEYYNTLKEFYASVVKKQAEKIVLVKKS